MEDEFILSKFEPMSRDDQLDIGFVFPEDGSGMTEGIK